MGQTNSAALGMEPFFPTSAALPCSTEAESATALTRCADAGDGGAGTWESAWIDLGGEG